MWVRVGLQAKESEAGLPGFMQVATNFLDSKTEILKARNTQKTIQVELSKRGIKDIFKVTAPKKGPYQQYTQNTKDS